MFIFTVPMAANGPIFPDGALTVGCKIAHTAHGVVYDATLLGVRVCATVRQ